ncbi:TolC family protein [Roseivirga echinicomitans]
MKKVLYTLSLLLLWSAAIHAQQHLTLQESIDIALSNNISIKRAKNNAISAKAGFAQSKYNFLPSLGAGASHRWNEGLNFDTNTGSLVNTTTLGGGGSINANLNIFDGFQNRINVSRSEFLYKSSEEAVKSSMQSTEANVVSSFLQLIITRENLKIAEETISLLNEQLDIAEKRERAGVGNMEQVYNLKAQVAQQQLTIVGFQNTLQSNELTLIQLLLLDPNQAYVFEGITANDAELDAELASYDQIYDKSLAYSPAIKSAQYDLEASKKALKIAQFSWMPSLTLGAGIGTSWSSNAVNVLERDPISNRATRTEVIDLSTQFENNVSKSASLSLGIPIFSRMSSRTQFQQSKIQMLNSELSLEQTKNALTNDIQQAYLNLVNAKTAYKAARESMINLNTSFEFAKSRYENGTIDFVTYLTSLNGKNRGELQLIQAKYTILFRQLILDIYTGELDRQD